MKLKVATLLKTDSFAEVFQRFWSQELNGNVVQHCFRKSEKSVLVFGTNTQIVPIYGLNVSFKMQF